MPKRKLKYVSADELPKWREKNTPPTCPILGHTGLKPVVDHDHKSGKIRGVISNEANLLIGKIENFFRSRCSLSEVDLREALENIAFHISREQSTYHPIGLRQVVKRFYGVKAGKQIAILEGMGATEEELEKAKNKRKRANLYRKMLINAKA